jgi:Zn-finger nucleic acid-binding protein
MLCPTCKAHLKMTHQHGVVIDFCTTCWGVWLDRDELDTILDRSAAAVAAAAGYGHAHRHPQRSVGGT